MAQSETPKTPPSEAPMTCGIACVEAVPSQDGGLLRSQKPARIQPRQPLMETPTKSFTDSGYTSLSTTPSEKSLRSDRVKSLHRGAIPLLFFTKKKVVFIDKPTDQSTKTRFRAIQPSFEKLLLEEMRGHQKPGTRYKPISTRLAMMGTSENDAQPHIAVFCQPEQKRLIQAFVKKDIVVDIYRPKDLDAPSFEVIVFGNAPRLRLSESNIEVITDAGNLPATPRDTLCGIPISFQHPNGQRRNATLGGIIKVVTAKGSIELLGMTAGHVLDEWHHDSDEDMLDARSPQNTNPAFPSPPQDDGSFVNETNEDEYSDYELDYIPFSEFPGALVEDEGALWDFQNLTILGEVIDVSKEDAIRSAGQRYDWALFRPILYKMNRVPANPKVQLSICNKRPGTVKNRRVTVLSSPTGCKVGSILSEPGRILLGGEEFVDAFMIRIRDGDSGSWVVDATRFEVYGQLVASDASGSGYVIPMTDIFSDVKSQLGAQTVELPSFVDIIQARTVADERRLATSVEDRYGCPKYSPQMMSTSIGSRPSTSILDHQGGYTLLDPCDISYESLDSGYSSLNPSPNPRYYLSPENQSPRLEETREVQKPVAGISNLKEEKRKNWRKRRFSGSQFLENGVEKKQAR
ncbi:hypothetical protein CHU98_g6171 [Xylaria longipes]|nr:hypothetical protein CHU98_g6171 [Xylaria longipes]